MSKLKLICTVPRCARLATTDIIGDWCLEHYMQWYHHRERKHPKWMTRPVKHKIRETDD